MSFTLTPEATEWYLEIPSEIQAQCWEASRNQAIESSQWNAYLNRLCLNAVLAWLQAEDLVAAVWLGLGGMPGVWEFVNGAAITIGAERWILIPSESIEDDFEVPQEWVDIPSWAGDYYLGIQVRADGEGIRVWGYATHRELKGIGHYDADDRVYTLGAEQMIQDMDALAVVRSRWTQAQTRGEVATLAAVPAVQAENLVQRLGNGAVRFPRLAVPFGLWGALLESGDWRQRLYEQRTGRSVTRLGDWFAGTVNSLWQVLDGLGSPQVASAWRGNGVRSQPMVFDVNRVRTMAFGERGEQQVALIMGVSALSEVERAIGLQVQAMGDRVPESLQVRLLDEDGAEAGQASASQTESIELQFDGRRDEVFVVEVCCGAQCMTETFVV
jgi:hypothetical protein